MLFSWRLVSSSGDEVVESTEAVNTKEAFVLIGSEPLKNQVLLTKLNKQIQSSVESKILSLEGITSKSGSDIANSATISEYDGTDIKSIVVPVNDNVSYVTYSNGDKLMEEEGMLINYQRRK